MKEKSSEEILQYIIDIINSTEDSTVEEFNNNPDVKKIYAFIYNEEDLIITLNRELELNANRFCNLEFLLNRFIEIYNIDLEVANKYLDQIIDLNIWSRIHLVKFACDRKQIELAIEIANQIPNENKDSIQYQAYRHILNFYSKEGDIENFKKYTKKAKLGKFPRYGIENYKSNLLAGYARKKGIEKGLELSNQKYFNNTGVFSLLRENSYKISIRKIDNLLKKYDYLEKEYSNIKAWLYVSHFDNKKTTSISDRMFNKVLKEIIKVDRTQNCGDLKCIDCLIMDFTTVLNYEQIEKIKKYIVSRKVKKEINEYIKDNLK